MELIDSASHPAARRLADVLKSKSNSPKSVVVDDAENIEQAIASRVEIDSVYTSADPAGLDDFDTGARRYQITGEVVDKLFGAQKQSRIFALAQAPRPARLCDLADRSGDVVVLDGVRLVGNIGAIIRTSVAFGAAGLVLLDSGLKTYLDRRLIRASRGLVFALPVVIATQDQFRDFVRREQLPLAGLHADAPQPLRSIREVPERLGIVLGSERSGLSPEVDELITHHYAIAISADVESLNVSVSAGIALYEHSGLKA